MRRLAWLTLAFVTAAHWHVHLGYLRGLNTLGVPPVPAAPARKIAKGEGVRHAVVVVLDGLGFEKGIEEPALQKIAGSGAVRMMRAEFPTFTYPGITSMVTGRPPLYSGVRINGPRPKLPWDSVPKRAAAAGYAVRYDPELFKNFASLLLLPESAERMDPPLASSSASLPPASGPRTLDILYEGRVDRAAHRYGTESDAYRDVVRKAAERTAAVWRTLDPLQDLLVVVSEHGHRLAGGHGGAEPEAASALLVAAGKGVPAAGRLRGGWMRDLAPTVAALLGADAPADSLGLPMRDLLGLAGDLPRAYDQQAAADSAIFERQAKLRVGLVALLLAIGFTVLIRRGRLHLDLRDFLPFAIYLPIVAAGHLALGLSISWSIPSSQLIYQGETLVIGLAAAAVAIRFASRRERAREELAAVLCVALPAYLLALAWVGLTLERIAGPLLSFGFLLTVTVVFYASLAFALRALWLTHAPDRTAAQRALAWTGGVLAALVLYAAPMLARFYLPR